MGGGVEDRGGERRHVTSGLTGDAAQTLLAKANVTVVMTNDAPVYEVVVRRSFAPYLWRWLCHAADVVV